MDNDKLTRLKGQRITREEIAVLDSLPVPAPAALLSLLESSPLAGAELSLDMTADLSKLGAYMRIMRPVQIVSEAVEHFPGIVAIKRGMIPFAMCLEGSGDPYFYASDGSIVRVPHDAVVQNRLDTSRLELVAQSVEMLVALASDQ